MGFINTVKSFFISIFRHKLILILLILTQIVSSFAVLYSYSLVRTINYNENKVGVYRIKFDNPMPLSNVLEKAQSLQPGTRIKICIDEEGMIFTGYPAVPSMIHSGTDMIDNASQPQIYIPYSLAEEITIGSYMELFGKDYLVIGATHKDTFYINIGSLEEEALVYNLEIVNEKMRSTSEINRFARQLKQNFEQTVDYVNPLNDWFNLSEFGVLAISVMTFAALSFSIGYGYIVGKAKKEFFVFRLVGQSKLSLFTTLLITVMLIVLAQFCITVSIYALFDALWFPSFYVMEEISTTYKCGIADYVVIGSLITILVGITVTASSKKSINANHQQKE